MKPSRLAIAALALTLSRCRGTPHPDAPRPSAASDAAAPTRERAIAEIPPPGPSADGRERDVPLSWIYLLAQPSPTGRPPSAIVGATLPCGFAPYWAGADKAAGEVRVRLRARWERPEPPPSTPRPCERPRVTSQLVSLSVLRLGEYRVVDGVPHGQGDPPAPPAVVQRVVRDDATLAPIAERWTRPCATDRDCDGGVCSLVGSARVCLSPIDPWRSAGRPCPDGATAVNARRSGGEGAPWEACIAACEGGRCPGSLRCDPAIGACLPASTPPATGEHTDAAGPTGR